MWNLTPVFVGKIEHVIPCFDHIDHQFYFIEITNCFKGILKKECIFHGVFFPVCYQSTTSCMSCKGGDWKPWLVSILRIL